MNSGYESPLSTRYVSEEMQYIFSSDKKFLTWRRLWIALARAEKKLGLPITDTQIAELERFADNINYDVAQQREKESRHDVMSHVYAYGVQCPQAKGIIHLGATSCYIGDNTDIIVMRDALRIIRRKIINVIALLSEFAYEYRALPTLAYTHLQPAQLTTVGKRAALWINELLMDLDEMELRLNNMRLLGSKGATGTQASFLELFDGDVEKVMELERLICAEMDFSEVVPVSGQTYSRKIDAQILSTLSGIAQSAAKFSNDLRILQGFKEVEEPFEKGQIGSSAMPYKRNPMRCERMAALARFVMIGALNPAFTAASQWFERTLDDSANKRLAVSEAFLAVDAIVNIMLNVCDGMVVYPKVIERRVMNELPFIATENILMSAVKKGGDRQLLHERLKLHCIAAAKEVKEAGSKNDLIERICNDSEFNLKREEIDALLDPQNFTGLSALQVDMFLDNNVRPILENNAEILGEKAELKV